jgi:hypothetical protein
MNTGYNNFNSATLTGLVDINADSIVTNSITVSDLTLENALNVVELNFSDNINGITTTEFAEIPNISNNHIDILALQGKTQNISYADSTPETRFTGLLKTDDIICNDEFLCKGVANYEGRIRYNNTFTGFNNSSTGVSISVAEFERLDGVTSSIQTQLNTLATKTQGMTGAPSLTTFNTEIVYEDIATYQSDLNLETNLQYSNTTNFINYNNGVVITANAFGCLDGVTSSIQTQLNNKESSTSINIDCSRLADGSVNNTKFQHINTLSSNCQTQLNTKAVKSANNTFTGTNTFNQIDIEPNYQLYIAGDTGDDTNSIHINSGNINFVKGFIKGRADGFNYANDSYDTYTGYCYNLASTAVGTVDNATTALNGIRTLPQGVYMISGVIIVNKGTASYSPNSIFDTSWTATGGTVPSTINRFYVFSDSIGSLRVLLPTTYFIVTGSGVLKPRYNYNFFALGSSTVSFDVSIIRIA